MVLEDRDDDNAVLEHDCERQRVAVAIRPCNLPSAVVRLERGRGCAAESGPNVAPGDVATVPEFVNARETAIFSNL